MPYRYFPIEFSSYEDYVKYLKEKGLAIEVTEDSNPHKTLKKYEKKGNVMKSLIGKRVFRLVENQFGGFSPDKSALYTIIKVYCPEDDFHMHYVLRDDNGNELDIVEYECVVAPNFATPLLSCLTTYLQENGICGEVSGSDFARIRVLIEWGDWKHGHLWCKDLMGYIGYKEIGYDVTEEDGSDCYSAVHYFEEEIPQEYLDLRENKKHGILEKREV